jgi:hypothetical protein
MFTAGSFEYFEDAHARMRDLQSGPAQILGFHTGLLTRKCSATAAASVRAIRLGRQDATEYACGRNAVSRDPG